jgi:hypothetical protein
MRYVVTTESNHLHVRLTPRTSASIIRVLPRGGVVDIDPLSERPNGWRKNEWLQLTTGGWVAAAFLTSVGERPTVPLRPPPVSGLPPFESLWNNYPPESDVPTVKRAIGGHVDAAWIENTCAVRLSRALNYSNRPIPNNRADLHVVTGGDQKYYAFRVKEMRRYLESSYGKATYVASGAGAHMHMRNKRGIIMFDVRGWSNATGHFDIWNGSEARHHAYFSESREVLLWSCS